MGEEKWRSVRKKMDDGIRMPPRKMEMRRHGRKEWTAGGYEAERFKYMRTSGNGFHTARRLILNL